MTTRFGIAAVGCMLLVASTARGQSPGELAMTREYLAGFQNPDGGFGGAKGEPSTLGATSSAIRTLKNVAGSIRDVPGCIAFLKSCRVASGGFAPKPGGAPELLATAVGLMAVAEMKVADKETIDGAIAYFHESAKTFEDIRIAVAGLEAVAATSADFPRWIEQVKLDRNPDGTWGSGAGKARATGSAAVALLRMGVDLSPEKPAILAALRSAGQQSDGAWSRDEGPSDLEPTYRIMRAFFMMKESPHIDALRSYLDRCRQPDGSYGTAPGKPGSPGGTYFATIILRWAKLLDGEPAILETAGFKPLFDGKTLDGWEGDGTIWSAKDGMIVGKSAGIDHNEFLATKADYGDFILQFSFRMLGSEQSNSGMQFRSVRGRRPRDVRLPGRHRPGVLGRPLRRVAPQQDARQPVRKGARASPRPARETGTTTSSGRWGTTST